MGTMWLINGRPLNQRLVLITLPHDELPNSHYGLWNRGHWVGFHDKK